MLSEQHPREQGLKLKRPGPAVNYPVTPLSEQHPREQGLKLTSSIWPRLPWYAFRATSKRTRIETIPQWDFWIPVRLFQSNIQENKDWNSVSSTPLTTPVTRLSEQHPREQGLKRERTLIVKRSSYPFRATSKRTRIETVYSLGKPSYQMSSFRATSKRTRIETGFVDRTGGGPSAFRATSKRTRIETSDHRMYWWAAGVHFQSNIQENKDWNWRIRW